IYRFFGDTQEAGVDVVLLALGDNLALVHGDQNVEQWEQICRTAGILLRAYYDQYREVVEPEPLLSGRDLLELLGMEPGPQVGRILKALREAQATGEVTTKEEALGLARSLLEERGG
ncbi:MAG TPA: polynucleotide adenylyltransferase, partial [Chloroflexi bacterium]|nr:polynucleotide adenylyltransferase [Chloroflexota bacterium]